AHADGGLARAATPAQEQPAEDRDVLPRADAVPAGRTMRARLHEVVAIAGLDGAFRVQVQLAVAAPAAVQHLRQAVDHDVQEAADHEAEDEHHGHEQTRVTAEQVDQITEPILKIGRYIATTRPPTSTPRIAMINGSSRLE